MVIKFNEYYDKVRACFLGKNVGGTVGAPLRRVFSPTMTSTFSLYGFSPPKDSVLLLIPQYLRNTGHIKLLLTGQNTV